MGLIPAGAREILIEEVAEAANFLALRGEDPDRYFLNGGWTIQWNGVYQVAGTTFTYVRTGDWENLTSPGPTSEPVWIQVCATAAGGEGALGERVLTATGHPAPSCCFRRATPECAMSTPSTGTQTAPAWARHPSSPGSTGPGASAQSPVAQVGGPSPWAGTPASASSSSLVHGATMSTICKVGLATAHPVGSPRVNGVRQA